MLNIENKRVFLACGKTDMRKNINGLAAIIESSFKRKRQIKDYVFGRPRMMYH